MGYKSRARIASANAVAKFRLRGTDQDLDYKKYWDDRYRRGGNSGEGSYGENAIYKARVINSLIKENNLQSVFEVGCGDGNNLGLYACEKYMGVDVSKHAIEICDSKYGDDLTKTFAVVTPGINLGMEKKFDLVICLEVLMHVIDEHDFQWTLEQIFLTSARFVAILNPLTPVLDFPQGHHEKYRNLLAYLIPYVGDFALIDVVTHPSATPLSRIHGFEGDMASDFVILERQRN